MDAGTHALASVALIRIVVPRAPLLARVFVVAAGTIADVDALSALVGPSPYLNWHHTYTHSMIAAAVFAVILGLLYFSVRRATTAAEISNAGLFSVFLLSSFLHLAMDACQSGGIALFWPVSARGIAADWLPAIDPWIIAILIASLALPELVRLVSDEIGAKSKAPRGRVGAMIGLVFVIVYVAARATLHAGVLATLDARSYHGEVARRSSAYAESLSLFTWHAIVETDRTLQELTVNAAPGGSSDPENGLTLFKPEPSPVLDHAQNTAAAKRFLRVASFPKATIEKTAEGYSVQIRDLRCAVSGEIRHEVIAVIQTDSQGSVTRDELLWRRDYRRR